MSVYIIALILHSKCAPFSIHINAVFINIFTEVRTMSCVSVHMCTQIYNKIVLIEIHILSNSQSNIRTFSYGTNLFV